MKKILILSIFFHLVFTANILSEEFPTIYLEEGITEIVFTIINNGNSDIFDINVVIDKENLPSWLDISEGENTIDVLKEERGLEKIFLKFDVTNAPSEAFAIIPYTLKDNIGNQWKSRLKVFANSNFESVPKAFDALYENFPNPFNPITNIKYSLEEEEHTKLLIYNSLGQVIKTLVNEPQTAGIHTVQWDSRDDNGQKVSSGLYIYRLEAGSFVKTRRMMLIE